MSVFIRFLDWHPLQLLSKHKLQSARPPRVEPVYFTAPPTLVGSPVPPPAPVSASFMHSTLLQSSTIKHTSVSERHGPFQLPPLRDMEAKQHPIKTLKSYPETGGRSLAAAAGGEGGGCGGYRAGSAEMEMEGKIQKAIDFKAEGHRCYKEKKFREAIGKYHRALLQLKGVHVVDGTTGSEVNLLSQAAAKLTEEQRRAVEITEIECYDSLTGEWGSHLWTPNCCWHNGSAGSHQRCSFFILQVFSSPLEFRSNSCGLCRGGRSVPKNRDRFDSPPPVYCAFRFTAVL